MNKSSEDRGPNPFVQAHRRSPMVFMKFLNFSKVKRSFIRGGREVGSYVMIWNILEEQDSIMETWKNS